MPPISSLRGRPIGRILIKMGKVTRAQVSEALELQKKRRGPLGQLLVEMGVVAREDVHRALAAQVGMESIRLADIDIEQSVINMVPAQMAHAYRVVPTEYDRDTHTLGVALASPDNFHATDDLKTLMGFNVVARITTQEDMTEALNRYYPEEAALSLTDVINELGADDSVQQLANRGESIDLETLKDAAESAGVKKLVNLVLLQAIRDKASDVHFEPFEDEYKMRYRIDGVLFEMMPPPKHVAMAISSRVKVMSNLDIAERRMPQDGRIELLVEGRPVDLRVSILPTMFGESVVLRVLDRSQVNLDLAQIGLRDEEMNIFRQLIGKPHGIIVVTGPTGSGKTTTLYSALRELNTVDVKILTSEDPVEYDIDGMIQCQIRSEIGLTFARCLRSFLRQDPDIILVGEIRDIETAQISVQASLTGHLVFTTLHTNDAPSSIARLLDLGLEPFLLTATLEAIVAQRLVRKICENCKEEYEPTEQQLMQLGLRPEEIAGRTFFYGRGCEYCNQTGYRGRRGIFEIMVMDDDMRELVMKHASTQLLRQEARKRGMRSLREAGLMLLYDGITTIDEIVRETLAEEVMA
ncbi:MAG: Flp pilus assembly complex ATPase component TadA [Phycisphaerales bacterium]|nr:Flp pilus assembly complex ATPase component TadA [Phycisphaerales bacterium]